MCGTVGPFFSREPLDYPCKRNGFSCQKCGSIGRNRHVALLILEEFQDRINCASLQEFGNKFEGNMWIGCVKEAVSRALPDKPNIFKSEYIDGLTSGEVRDGVTCQNIESTNFPDNFLDLIISEDVLEHVPNPVAAFLEIRRILKPGGKHIFTIPVDWMLENSQQRAIIKDGQVQHILEPEIHGDPFRPEGILAFYTFGQDVVERFCSLSGSTIIHQANGHKLLEQAFSIHNNWVFVSTK